MGRKMEYKSFDFELKKLTEEGMFEGYASTFGNIDRGDDKIEPGAFKKTLKAKKKKSLLWGHQFFNLPVGIITLKEDDVGLYGLGEFNMNVQNSRDVYELTKQGAIDSMSIGFQVIKDETKKIRDREIRIIREIDLFEVSLVTVPMNPKAQITDVKNMKYGDEIITIDYSNPKHIEFILQQLGEKYKDNKDFRNKVLTLFQEPALATPDRDLKAVPVDGQSKEKPSKNLAEIRKIYKCINSIQKTILKEAFR